MKAKDREDIGCRLVEISYRTRPTAQGDEPETGVCDAYITNEVDTWGKRTIFVTHNGEDFERWYLFPDEWERI